MSEYMKLEDFLKELYDKKGSDLFITVNIPPSIKCQGVLLPLNDQNLTPEQTRELIFSAMSVPQQEEFLSSHECNFALQLPDIGRYRASAFMQRSHVSAVIRRIESVIPTLENLQMPKALEDLALAQRGLVIVVGATGSGKSTSLAALIGHRNANSKGHIITIEDPIEYVHPHQGCIVSQREVGIDTQSFEVALKNTLRQAPDVILIGEIRTAETMGYAINFAETGHLCLATLHANNANQALDRIIHFFPSNLHQQILMDLSLNLKGIVAQQLLPTVEGGGRIAAVEVLLNSPLVSEHIRKAEVELLKNLMAKSNELGMQTFDQALFQLHFQEKISYETALKHADSENDLRLMIKLAKGSSGGASNLSLTRQ